MGSSNEFLTDSTSTQTDVAKPVIGTIMQESTLQQMTNVLESLLSHTHVFYDDYGTACNCNCNCNCQCTRGSL